MPLALLFALLLVASGGQVNLVLGQEPEQPSLDSANDIVRNGARVFAQSCAVCHGASGLGLSEAREAFPPDHQQCQRCHKTGNPKTMTLEQIEARQHDLFDVGDAPALRGDGALASHASQQALRAYLQAAMPRHNPGGLSDADYDAVSSFLLYLNGRR